MEELVGFGARVHTCSRNEGELRQCLRHWKDLEFEVSGSVCDVSVRAQREELMENAGNTFDGKLNILVRCTLSCVFLCFRLRCHFSLLGYFPFNHSSY